MTGKYVFQDWETGDAIGRGSFGTVYEIKKQDALGYSERAAMKHISIPQSDSDIEMLQSEGQDDESITETFKEQAREIINEYKLMKKLNDCPNIVSCDDYKAVQHDNDLGWDIFIKMELLTPLVKLLNGQILSEEQIRQLGIDLCNALIYCHNKNIIHRDIKPQNIFISADGIFKLGDFGIARIIMNGSSTGTAKIGTYDYMAPEVYHAQHYSISADIYSLGIVLYWLLNNRRCPFQPTEKQRLTYHEKEEARNRRFAGESIPMPLNGNEEFKRIVLKACAFDRKDRYQSAEDMLADLAKLGGERIGIPSVPAKSATEEENKQSISDRSEGRNITKETEVSVGSRGKEDRSEEDSDYAEDGKTVGAFDNPPQPLSNQKRKKRQPLWIWIILAVEVVVIGFSLIHIWKMTQTSMPMQTPTPWIEGNWNWSFEDGVLTITGMGNMKNYDDTTDAPWYADRYQIKRVIIEKGITGIGNHAFANCSALESVMIPESVTSIGDSAFEWCDSLTTIEMPSSVTSIGDSAFKWCRSLMAINIPSGVTRIGVSTFASCSSLTTIEIPPSVMSIDSFAFNVCGNLTKIEIPSSVKIIGVSAFDNCYSLTDVYYTGTEAQWDAINVDGCNDALINALIHCNSE